MAGFRNSPLFNQLAEKPEILAALSKMAEFLKKSGVCSDIIAKCDAHRCILRHRHVESSF
ncbi:hypothetical protein FS749_008168 [Ceratobasidium sp. UAMH 11750]|nr:hypothetical protein FS749_008168 [Ceratobasidium sp. UAMH 11750]